MKIMFDDECNPEFWYTFMCAHDGDDDDKALSLNIMFKADSLPAEFGQLDGK